MNAHLVAFSTNAFVEDAVRFVLGGASIEHLAALHAMKPCEMLAALDDSTSGEKVVDLDEVDACIAIKRKEAGHAA